MNRSLKDTHTHSCEGQQRGIGPIRARRGNSARIRHGNNDNRACDTYLAARGHISDTAARSWERSAMSQVLAMFIVKLVPQTIWKSNTGMRVVQRPYKLACRECAGCSLASQGVVKRLRQGMCHKAKMQSQAITTKLQTTPAALTRVHTYATLRQTHSHYTYSGCYVSRTSDHWLHNVGSLRNTRVVCSPSKMLGVCVCVCV